MQPTYSILFTTVVVGSVKPIGVYVAFHVIARAVPLSMILRTSLLPSWGEPVGAATSNAAACAVKLYWSYDEMSGVKVAVDVVVLTRGLIRLFVSVSAPA